MSNKNFQPMRAAKIEDLNKLVFPLYALPKYDGIRCCMVNGVPTSNSLKALPNKHLQDWSRNFANILHGLDGEIIVGEHDAGVFNRTTSAIMSREGTPDFKFVIFDSFLSPKDFFYRYGDIQFADYNGAQSHIEVAPAHAVENLAALLELERHWLAQGYEGVMLRKPDGLYKYGRSTFKEHGLLKLKRFEDAEAMCIGYKERMHNTNPKVVNALGLSERSSHKAGMVPAGDLGALLCRRPDGVEFEIGSKLTQAQREALWDERSALAGRIVKYKHFAIGAKDAPRFPTFLGFRHILDIESEQARKLLTEKTS